ncbi:hypothetical protein F2Q69_00041094 [Brassica cretica]|uniref:Uncharacterized protein n=1 Tax=Brassica cretica TaxID=69181 RepID=A0A8S9NR06_BRACR|nr:hypothetical protein F2Q69_00041094 [Brassica cretica]
MISFRVETGPPKRTMNLELHTDGRELGVVGCELNGMGRVCFLSGLQAADRDCELVDREHELAVMRTEAEITSIVGCNIGQTSFQCRLLPKILELKLKKRSTALAFQPILGRWIPRATLAWPWRRVGAISSSRSNLDTVVIMEGSGVAPNNLAVCPMS